MQGGSETRTAHTHGTCGKGATALRKRTKGACFPVMADRGSPEVASNGRTSVCVQEWGAELTRGEELLLGKGNVAISCRN